MIDKNNRPQERPFQHLQLRAGEVCSKVILVDDPFETDSISKMLEQGSFVHHNREHRIFQGFYKGEQIMVISTGIGAASAAIAAEESIRAGAKQIIMVNNALPAGNSRKGDVIVSEGSCKMEGLSRWYYPLEMPAVPDFSLYTQVMRSARRGKYVNLKSDVGITVDTFYSMPATLQTIPAAFLDLESAAIFSVAYKHAVQAAHIAEVVEIGEDGTIQYTPESRREKYMLALESLACSD